MRSYEMYVFDVDDTLIRTSETVIKRHYPRLAEIMGVPYPGEDKVRRHWGGDLAVSLEKIFGIPLDRSEAITTLQRLYQEHPVKPIDGIHRILDILRKHDKFIGLISCGHPSIIDLCIQNSLSRNKEDFDFIFSTVEQQITKPSPHIVFAMMERYRQLFGKEVQLEQVLMIGDSVTDFLTAKNAKVDFAAVLTGPATRDDFVDAGLDAECIFPSIKEALVPPSDHGTVAIIRNRQNEFLLIQEARPGHPYYGHWAGPHGVCKDEDILEEETVVRETIEECGIAIKPIRKLYTRSADTKVSTVSFWEAELRVTEDAILDTSSREVGAITWFALEDIVGGKILLYPGSRDFFEHYQRKEGEKHGRGN